MPTGLEMRTTSVAQFSGLRIGNAGADRDLLQSQAFGRRSQPVHDVVQFVGLEVERRPDIQEDAIPVEPFIGPPSRLEHAGCPPRLPMSMRSRCGSCTMRPASSRTGVTIAHFGTGKQPLVFRIIAGDAMQKVDIFHRRQPIDVEVARAAKDAAACPSWDAGRDRTCLPT